MNKSEVLFEFPQQIDEYYIREANEIDFCIRADWPIYPTPYEIFNSSARSLKFYERIRQFRDRNLDSNIILSVIDKRGFLVGHFALLEIDWNQRIIGNMGIRIHPKYCDKGIGSRILNWLCLLFQNLDFKQIELDVLGTNSRAIRSYEKAGFISIKQFEHESEVFIQMRKSLHPS